MRRYALVSGVFFTLLACVQILRLVMQWSVRVADFDVPLWASGIAAVIVAGFAIWAFRVASQPPPPAV